MRRVVAPDAGGQGGSQEIVDVAVEHALGVALFDPVRRSFTIW